MNGNAVSRRGFLQGTALAAAGVAAAGLMGCSSADGKAKEDFLPESWDQEADIIIVGFGGAGIAAAITAADEGLGDALVLEAAPEGEEGGNTRVSQQAVFTTDDPKALAAYQKNLNDPYIVPDDRLLSWAEALAENPQWLIDQGADMVKHDSTSEYPDIEGHEAGYVVVASEGIGNENLWKPLRARFDELGCKALWDTRVTNLIFDPATKEVRGVKAVDGRTFKARKGVLIACGGFEKDEKLLDTYYPVGSKGFWQYGTPHNFGDGIRMCQEIGASLWHMNNYAVGSIASIATPGTSIAAPVSFAAKDYIFVGPNAKRWLYEETQAFQKHGKYNYNGNYVQVHEPFPAWAILGSKCFEAGPVFKKGTYGWASIFETFLESNQAYVDAGMWEKADSAEELAKKIGVDPNALAETIATYNGYCANGKDEEFGRGEAAQANWTLATGGSAGIKPFDLEALEPPFYAIPIRRGGANSQGGPERGVNFEVLSTDGAPIPRLYAGGECGAIYPYKYEGGGNVSEAIATGRVAARQIGALSSWEEQSE